ncbi:hypothetical protein L5I01_28715 [Gordonia sp. HY442]|uniref:hypothetical protein n=1 Tax=Gordonia zhenghanii TaxID=2911516 RepID=UPI001F202E91|nr:hypothetical protein [Gordonia zhenghanii]MCF8607347.1 hypothetical protein [Gordonia zhenghanii]
MENADNQDILKQAVDLLEDAEDCPRVSGTALMETWGKGDASGPAKRVSRAEFVSNNRSGNWLEKSLDSVGIERRYSASFGQEHIDNGKSVDYIPADLEWPVSIRMLRPKSALDIWGGPNDNWRMVDAVRDDDSVVVKLIDRFDQGTAELQIDTTLKLPVRWTRLYPAFGGVKSEVELVDLLVPRAWISGDVADIPTSGVIGASFGSLDPRLP